MTDHPDIDELFDDDVAPAAGDDRVDTDHEGAQSDAAARPDDDDLLVLADRAAARAAPAPDDEPAASERRAVPADPIAEQAEGTDGDDRVVLQFPSDDFPPPPVFRLTVPRGWLAVPVPEALMAVRRPDDIDGFHPNVLVRNRRVAAADDPGTALANFAAVETVPEGMEVLHDEVRTRGRTPARWMQVRFPTTDGPVLQARHLLIYVPATRHVANVVSVVGTWPDHAAEDVATEVTDVVGSLRLFLPDEAI